MLPAMPTYASVFLDLFPAPGAKPGGFLEGRQQHDEEHAEPGQEKSAKNAAQTSDLAATAHRFADEHGKYPSDNDNDRDFDRHGAMMRRRAFRRNHFVDLPPESAVIYTL